MRIHAGNPIPKRNFILFACALIAAPVLFSGCLESGKIDVSSSKNFDRQGLSISAEDVLVGGLSKISVSINYIPPHDVTLHLKTQTVDATEGYDYQPLDLDLTIPAGTTHAEIPLVTFQQNQIPGDHHLKIVASNVSGADVLDSEAPITIQERKFSKVVTGATLLSAGLSHICAKLSDKKVYCWGSNGDGQVTGDGVASNTGFSKTLIAGLPQDPIRIAAHAYNSCALYANGDVLCWGYNGYGNIEQPANAHVVDTPWGSILPAGKTAIDVYNSGYHTCVVYTDGTVGCQGQGGYGALGYGSFVDIRTLQTVTTLPGPATTVAATYYNTCAALSTGAVWCWGDNTYGENGTGVIGGSTNVANASLLTAGVVALTSGFAHHCALLSDGTVKCWGYNLQSQLGFSGANSATPTQVTLPRPAVQVSAAGNSTCALLDTGEMYCWGANYFGSLGDGTSLGQVSPVKVKGFSDAVQSISKGVDRTCAILKTDGRPMCWGGNDRLNAIAGGQEPKAPTDFPGVIGQKVKDVMMAQSWTSNLNGSVLQVGCVVLDNGATQCSGDNSYRALGIGGVGVALYSGDPRITLTQASGLGAGTTLALSTGRNFTCALLANTGVKCWGDNSLDQIGNNSVFTVAGFKVDPGATPTGLTTGVAQVSSFGNFSCAVMADASVQCWGYSDTGKSGTCATASSKNPVTIAGLSSIASVTTGFATACALTSTGQMKCWGSNQSGLYANGAVSNACNATPIAATLPVPLVKVALGQLHACGLTATGAVYCWGNNAAGAVGMPLSQIYLTPQLVPGLEAGVLDVVTGNLHSCALLKDASVRCWGDDHKSQLGINRQHTNTIYTPTQPVGLGLGIKSIHAGEFNTCAVTTDGFAKCWGSNSGSIFDQGYDSIYFPHEVSDEQPSF